MRDWLVCRYSFDQSSSTQVQIPYQCVARLAGIAERMLLQRVLREPEWPGRWRHLIQSFWPACCHKKTYRTLRMERPGFASLRFESFDENLVFFQVLSLKHFFKDDRSQQKNLGSIPTQFSVRCLREARTRDRRKIWSWDDRVAPDLVEKISLRHFFFVRSGRNLITLTSLDDQSRLPKSCNAVPSAVFLPTAERTGARTQSASKTSPSPAAPTDGAPAAA